MARAEEGPRISIIRDLKTNREYVSDELIVRYNYPKITPAALSIYPLT